jgi:hypothetical protein
MNALECLNTPFCARLALSLAHFLWEGAVIALAAWGVAAALRRHSSRARYGVYCLALGAMVCALAGTILLVEPPRSRNAAAPRISQRESGSAAFLERPKGERDLAAGSFADPGNVLPGENTGMSPQGAGGAMKSRWESISAPLARWWGAAWPVCAPYVSGAYLVGLLAMMLRLVAGLGGSGRLRRMSQPVDDVSVLAALARQAQALGLNFTPPIAFCRRAVVPTVVGILRPTILLPFTFVTGLSADQIEMLLAHELAHVRRWDPLVNVAQRLIEALLFFHPAMWLISRRIRIERELCCDDLVVALGGRPLEYASSLVETAGRVRPSARPAFLPAEGLKAAASVSQLKSRVKRLLGQPEHEALRISRAWVVLCCIAVGALLSGIISSGESIVRQDSPADVAKMYLAALSRHDWEAAARMCRPGSKQAANAYRLGDICDFRGASIGDVYGDEDQAIAVTSGLKESDGRTWQLGFSFEKVPNGWQLHDIDWLPPGEELKFIAGFQEARPDAEKILPGAQSPAKKRDLTPPPPKKAHLPHVRSSGKVVLDLASGEMLAPEIRNDDIGQFTRLGKGDLAWDKGLWCLRGGMAAQWDGKNYAALQPSEREGDSWGYNITAFPSRLLIQTAEDRLFEVTVLIKTNDGGADIRYQIPVGSFRVVPEFWAASSSRFLAGKWEAVADREQGKDGTSSATLECGRTGLASLAIQRGSGERTTERGEYSYQNGEVIITKPDGAVVRFPAKHRDGKLLAAIAGTEMVFQKEEDTSSSLPGTPKKPTEQTPGRAEKLGGEPEDGLLRPERAASRLQFRWVADDPEKTGAERFELAQRNGKTEEVYLEKKVLLDESDVLSTSVWREPSSISPSSRGKVRRFYVFLQFNPEASKRFAEITGGNASRCLGIVFDGRILSAPMIKSKIPNGKVSISGFSSKAEAEAFCRALSGENAGKAGSSAAPTSQTLGTASSGDRVSASPVTTHTLKVALEGIRARKTLLESKPLRIEYTRTYKFFQPPATFPCVLLAHNGSYKETEKRPGGKEIDRYCYRGFRMEIHRDGEAKGKEAGSAETGSVDNAAKRLSEFRVGDGTSGPGPVNVHTFSLVHWVDETIAREISGEIAGDQRFSLESLEKTMAASLPNSRFEEVGGIRCLRFAEPVEPGADFYAPELGWALLASDRATLKAQDFATVQGFSFPMRMERDAEIIEVRKVEVLDDPAKTDADLTPPAIQRDGAGVVLYTPQWDPKYTTKEGCAKAGGIGHTISPIRWGKDLSPRENRLLIAAASEFYLPALGKAIQTGYPVPYYDVNRDLIVWAKFDRDPGYNVVMHEGDALPEKFGKTPWAVSLDPRVITNPDGSNPPVKTDEGPDSALKNAKNQDPTFNILISRDTPEETARAIKEAAIGQWKALLKRSDLSAAQKTFARWRIGELLSVQYPSSLAEAEQSAPILQTARDSGFLSEEVFNAATLYATSSIEPFERERRLAESYAWLRSISDADIVRNAPLINRYGYLIALKFFVPEKADITDPPVPEREKWLRDRLADARKTLETSIGENIESSRKRAPVLYLLAGLRNVADPEQLARWRSMPSRYASEWESEAEAWKTIDTMLKDGPHEGVQVRLKTEKSVWKADEQPVFKIDLKSEKERILPHYGPPLDDFDVRLDGVWYRRNKSGERQENLRSLGPSPGTSRENVGFLLRPDFWCRSDDKITTMPSLAPGKHTLEVALPLDSADKATSQPLRAVSNPVEIEIAEKSVSLLGQIHDVLRKVRGSGTDFDAREKELLALLNDYTDPKDIGAIYAACARIHYGTGSTHFDRLVKYARKSLEYPLDLEARMMACMRWGEGLQMQGGGSAADLPRQPREEIVKPFLRAIRLTLDAGIPEQPVAVPKLTATRVGGGMVGLDPEVEKRMKKEYDAQIGAIEEATRTNKIIVLRKFHEEKIVALYSQKPLATEELRQIATEIIGNPTVVSNLIARVNERIEEKSWGGAVRGVQIRLRDAKPARGDGVTSPVLLLLKADATNTGNLLLHLAENGNNCQVEVDGHWYMWFPDSALERIGEVKRDGDGAGKGSALLDFGGGKRYTDLSVTIGSHHWRALPAGQAGEIAALEWGNAFLAYRPEDIGAAMRLAPGKHRVRVAYNCGSARAGQDIGSVRAVSNPLEVEIP